MSRGRAMRFGAVIALLFLLRGVFVVGITAPFEGWDEHQHLAYVVFLDEEGRRPVSGRDVVPESLYATLRALPHTFWGAGNVEPAGGRTYKDFWDGGEANGTPDTGISLYQSQHGPLAYALMLPAYRLAGRLDDPLRTIAVLRLMNLLLASLGIYFAATTIYQLLAEKRHAHWIALACTCNPLLLMNAARIGNDALAFMLGTAAVCVLLRTGPSPSRRRVFMLGLILGAAVLAKLTNAPIVLAAFLGILWGVRGNSRWLRKTLILWAVLAAGMLSVCGFELVENVRNHGTLVAERRTVAAAGSETGWETYLEAATALNWPIFLRARLAQGSLWLGGWSYGRIPSHLVLAYLVWIAATAGALLITTLRRSAGVSLQGRDINVRILLLGTAYLAALCTHGLLSFVGEDMTSPRTNVFYAAVMFPWFYLFLLRGGRWRAPGWLAAALLVLFSLSELWGHLLVQAPHAAATRDPALVWERLKALHPAWMGPSCAAIALAVYAIGLILFVKKAGCMTDLRTTDAA